jgi:hypothetical protein
MSHYCHNSLTIKFSSENHLHDFVYDYVENYAGAREKKIVSKGTRGIITTCFTHEEPDFEWLEKILQDYRGCWIQNDWASYIQGVAGVWVGSWNESIREECPEDPLFQVINQMKWKDLSLEDRATLFGWRQEERARGND